MVGKAGSVPEAAYRGRVALGRALGGAVFENYAGRRAVRAGEAALSDYSGVGELA